MEKKWHIAKNLPKNIKDKFPEIHPVILQLLYNRGLKTQHEIDEFLSPDYSHDLHDPFIFKDMKRAVNRIYRAVSKKEKIVICADSDADGASSGALLFNIFKKIGIDKLEVHVPDRETEGYGLNMAAVENFINKGVNLIVTCDCGISNYKEVDLANKGGTDVIITDHHHEPKILPKAVAIINPQLSREKYPNKCLAGVGVAFKLAQALLLDKKCTVSNKEAFEKWMLDLVAVGTVTDCMDLIGENRTLVKYGLIVLKKTSNLGLRSLISTTNLSNSSTFDTRSISHQIGPRLNVPGRIGKSNMSVKLLLSGSKNRADVLVEKINILNQDRQKIVSDIIRKLVLEIGKDPKEKILVCIGKNWQSGLLGLIATRIVDYYSRPVIILNNREIGVKGSGRSISGYNLYEAISSLKKYFFDFGGHVAAIGFTLKNSDDIDDFKENVLDIGKKIKSSDFAPKIDIEAEIKLEGVNWNFYDKLIRFEPFGKNNPQPNFLVKNIFLGSIRMVGKKFQHCQLIVGSKSSNGQQGRKMIYFSANNKAKELKTGDEIDVIFQIGVNQWNGKRELQMKVIDLKKSND